MKKDAVPTAKRTGDAPNKPIAGIPPEFSAFAWKWAQNRLRHLRAMFQIKQVVEIPQDFWAFAWKWAQNRLRCLRAMFHTKQIVEIPQDAQGMTI